MRRSRTCCEDATLADEIFRRRIFLVRFCAHPPIGSYQPESFDQTQETGLNTYEQNWGRFADQEEWERHCSRRLAEDDHGVRSTASRGAKVDEESDERIAELLSDLDAPLQLPKQSEPPIRFARRMPGWMRLIPDKLEEIANYEKKNREFFYSKLRAEQRALYAEVKAAEGQKVRGYRLDIPWIPGESSEARKRRLDNERYWESVGKTEATVRQHTDLTEMTPEERAKHIRDRDAKSKREWRKRNASKRP